MLAILHFNSLSYKVKSIDTDTALKMINNGAIILDVRTRERYQKSHIPHALSYPSEFLKKAQLKFPLSANIIVYSCKGNELALEATYFLNNKGYLNAFNLEDGYCGWKQNKLPVTSLQQKTELKVESPNLSE